MRKTYVGLVFVLVLILIGGIGYYYYNSTTSDSIYNSDNNVNTSSKKAVGEACTTNSECETNTCTEGYCQYSSSTNLDEATATEYTTPDVSVSDTVTSDSSTKCVEIKRYGSATVSKGSVVVYKFVYQSSSSTNPLANVGLVVSGGIGRDFYRKNSATVKPSILDGNPKYDSTKQIWTYYFTWEAENPTDNIIKNISATNELEGIVYTNSNKPSTAISSIDCIAATDTSVASDLAVDLVLNKFVNEVCNTDGTAQYIFDIRVTNIGQQQTTIDSIKSDYDLKKLLVSPLVSTITKSGTNSGKTVSWNSVGNIGVGETQKFSYILNLDPSDIKLAGAGLSTLSTLKYGSSSAEFEKIITPICSGKVTSQIPVTGLFDSTINYLFLGLFLLLAGLFSIKYVNVHPRILMFANKMGVNSEFTAFENKILKEHEKQKRD